MLQISDLVIAKKPIESNIKAVSLAGEDLGRNPRVLPSSLLFCQICV